MTFQTWVKDSNNHPVQGALVCANDEVNGQSFMRGTDGRGYADVNMAGTCKAGDRVTLFVNADGFKLHVEGDALIITDANQVLNITLQPSFNRPSVTVGLVAEGQHFRKADGTPFTAIEATDFNLFGRYMNGEDISRVLTQRAKAGFNMLRVFTAYNVGGIGRLIPDEHPDYYSKIHPFADLLAQWGFYIELIAFTGPYTGIFANDLEKIAHWVNLTHRVVGIPNVLVEMVNEYDHPANKDLPFDRLDRPAGVMCSHGSATMDVTPLKPFWSYATYHPASSEWQRKVGHNAMEIWVGPTLTNETVRYPDNEQSVIHAEDAAAGATLLCAGGCFHSVSGKASQGWNATELAAASAWVKGATSVKLSCQNGAYSHRADLEGNGIIRAYQRGIEVVRIRA